MPKIATVVVINQLNELFTIPFPQQITKEENKVFKKNTIRVFRSREGKWLDIDLNILVIGEIFKVLKISLEVIVKVNYLGSQRLGVIIIKIFLLLTQIGPAP